MKFSIIIPVYNGENTIKKCLDSIFALDHDDFELIVVDDFSEDATISICEKYDNLKLIRLKEGLGAAEARNIGVEEAGGDVLVFTDSDCIVEKDWLNKIEGYITPEIGGIGGIYKALAWQNVIGRFATYDWYNYWFRWMPTITDSVTMGNSAFWKEVYNDREKIEGTLFKRMAAAEDTVMTLTIDQKKHPIMFCQDLYVYHISRDSISGYFKQQMTRGYSRTIISFLFPKRKVMKAKDINLRHILSQLFLTLAIPVSLLVYLIWGMALPLLGSMGLFLLLQISALRYIYQQERSISFLFLSLGLIYLRNLGWIVGAGKGLLYLLRRPFNRPKI